MPEGSLDEVIVSANTASTKKSLTAAVGEEFCLAASCATVGVLQDVESFIPDFEALKDAVLKLLKENEKLRQLCHTHEDLKKREIALKEENNRLYSTISLLGDQKRMILHNKSEIEKLEKLLGEGKEEVMNLQQNLEEARHENVQLQRKIIVDVQEAVKLGRIERDEALRRQNENFTQQLQAEREESEQKFSEMQFACAADLSKEKQLHAQQMAEISKDLGNKSLASESAMRDHISVLQQKLSDADARIRDLEQSKMPLLHEIENLRRVQSNQQVLKENGAHAFSRSLIPPQSAMTPATQPRRRVHQTESDDVPSETELEDPKQKNQKRTKSSTDSQNNVRRQRSASNRKQPQPLDFGDPYAYV